MGSVLLARNKPHPLNAPLLFTICVDLHRLELIMARWGWNLVMNDLSIRVFGIQDAALMAENMSRKWRQWFCSADPSIR
jgi:hypothetical protein